MSRPLRVLLLISDLGGGGAERQLSILARHLSRERFAPEICIWREVFKYELPPDLPVHLLRKTRWWHLGKVVRGTRRLIEELQPDLVYSQLHYVNMVTGTALAGLRHRPRWICRQSNDPRREMPWPFAIWARRSLARADRVIGCSAGVVETTREYLGLEAGRMVHLDNLADVERIRALAGEDLPVEKKPGTFTVVHAGRLYKQKNQAMLLEAFSTFRGRPAELWILGRGTLQADLERRAAELGIASQVRFLGFRENPFPFFRAADCLALSSDWEGLPNVVIEAMLCGTPAVATRCPFGPEELIEDGVTGLLVPVGEVAAFRAGLERLAANPEEREALGREAQRVAQERFDLRKVVTAYEDLFQETAQSRDSSAPGAR